MDGLLSLAAQTWRRQPTFKTSELNQPEETGREAQREQRPIHGYTAPDA